MKQQVGHFLKRYPLLYPLIAKIYDAVSFRYWETRLLGTKAQERWWAKRSIAEGYWNNRNRPSKYFLAERIAAFSPIDSILEVGCASGPSLYLLAKRFPQAEIRGIDINSPAIQYGNEQFAKEGISNVRLLVGEADELGQFQDRSFDIVFTNALFIYIGRDKINKVIHQMLRITRRALVLMELHCFESDKDPNGRGFYYGGNWVRNYRALLRQFVPEKRIRITKIPEDVWDAEPWRTFGAVIEVVI